MDERPDVALPLPRPGPFAAPAPYDRVRESAGLLLRQWGVAAEMAQDLAASYGCRVTGIDKVTMNKLAEVA